MSSSRTPPAMVRGQWMEPSQQEGRFKAELEFQQSLKDVVKYSRKQTEAALDSTACVQSFSTEVLNLSQHEYVISQSEKLSQFMFQYATTTSQLASVRHQMLEQVGTQFAEPMQNFLDFDFQETIKLKAELEQSRVDYHKVEEALRRSKFKDSKSEEYREAKLSQIEEDLEAARSQVENLKTAFNKSMDLQDEKKDFKLLRYLYLHMEMQATYFLYGHKLYTALTSKMEHVKKYLDNLDSTSDSTHITEGYLSKQGKKLGNFKRSWFILKNGTLNRVSNKMKKHLDMRLCSVRKDVTPKEGEKISKIELVFEIMAHNLKRPWVLQADNVYQKERWIKALNNAISEGLSNYSFGKPGAETNRKNTKENSDIHLKIIQKVPGNEVCADCEKKDPDWASINLGIVVCLECSGVHRSLGTHISKVRSLTLDKWDPDLLWMMKNLGNDRVNAILLQQVPAHSRLSMSADRDAREKWIKSKYVNKEFMKLTSPRNNPDIEKLIKNTENDLLPIVRYVLEGGDPNIAANWAEEAKNNLYITFLVQNGAYTHTPPPSVLTLADIISDHEIEALRRPPDIVVFTPRLSMELRNPAEQIAKANANFSSNTTPSSNPNVNTNSSVDTGTGAAANTDPSASNIANATSPTNPTRPSRKHGEMKRSFSGMFTRRSSHVGIGDPEPTKHEATTLRGTKLNDGNYRARNNSVSGTMFGDSRRNSGKLESSPLSPPSGRMGPIVERDEIEISAETLKKRPSLTGHTKVKSPSPSKFNITSVFTSPFNKHRDRPPPD